MKELTIEIRNGGISIQGAGIGNDPQATKKNIAASHCGPLKRVAKK